jgi:SAM-dependent methyltransferase
MALMGPDLGSEWFVQANRIEPRPPSVGGATDPAGPPAPWDRDEPHPLLVAWAAERGITGHGRRAVVVGCGLGADAEYIARLGFATTAFDISGTAIKLARSRYPRSAVRYFRTDLLRLPGAWLGAFDLVVDVFTAQSLPDPPRGRGIAAIGGLVAPGGSLLAVAIADDPTGPPPTPPPWPLSRAQIDTFAADGLTPVAIERCDGPLWRAEFTRPR